MTETPTEELKPLSEATGFEDFKKLRVQHRETTAEPAEKTPQVEETTAESAAEPATAEHVVQETQPAEKSIDDQIRDLRKTGKHAAANKLEREAGAAEAKKLHDAEIAALRAELASLRAPKTAPAASDTAAKPAQSAAGDPEPNVADAKYEGTGGFEKYLRDVARWEVRQEGIKAKETQARSEKAQHANRKVSEARAKYPDFDAATAGDVNTGTGLILTPAMQDFAFQHDSGMDVIYQLGKNKPEYDRIKTLPPAVQIAEMGRMAYLISTPPAGTPEKPKKPAVTHVAPPPRVLSGSDTPEPKSLSEARSYEEFRALRKARTA